MRYLSSDINTPWTEGFPLPCPLEPADAGWPPRFRTLGSLGSFADSESRWQFEPTLPPELELESIRLTCSGILISFFNALPFRMVYLRDGCWIGESPESVIPDLFSTRHEPVSKGHGVQVDLPDGPVTLAVRIEEKQKRFALVCGTADQSLAETEATANALLEDPDVLDHAWSRLEAVRDAWAGALPETDQPGRAMLALERVAAAITTTGDGITWHAATLDPSALPFLLEPIHFMGAEVVNGLLRQVAREPLSPAGWIPRHPDQPDIPAWPVWAQQLIRLPDGVVSKTTVDALAPKLESHLRALLGDWTAEKGALPQWPDRDAAFTPETAGGDLEGFDLACMLTAEMEAYAQWTSSPEAFRIERSALRSAIKDRHFSNRRKALLDRKPDGDLAGRITAATLLPLLWKDPLPGLPPSLTASPELRDTRGLRQWQPRDKDPAPPPVRLPTQHLLLGLMDRMKDETAAAVSAAWHRGIRENGLADDVLSAALYLRLLPYAARVNPELERYPGWVLYLERHRNGFVGTAATILFLIPVLTGILYAAQPRFGRVEEHLQAGHAEILTSLDRLPEAIEVYTEVLEKSRERDRSAFYFLQRGNLYYRQGAYEMALADFDQSIQADKDQRLHTARWNRAQALRELGRTGESIQAMQDFIDEYGEELDELANRARLAIDLMKR